MSPERDALVASREAVAAGRQKVEDRLEELRSALRESTGGRLVRRTWTLPVLAAAAGFSIALLLRAWVRRGGAGAWDDD